MEEGPQLGPFLVAGDQLVVHNDSVAASHEDIGSERIGRGGVLPWPVLLWVRTGSARSRAW